MLFDYKARNKRKKVVSGAIEANNKDEAVEFLTSRGLSVSEIQPQKKSILQIDLPFLNQVPAKEITIFSRQLSVMVTTNLPIVDALNALVKQTVNIKLKSVISDLVDEVAGGGKFSEALAKHPRIFDNFYVNMVRSGETSGRLDEVLNYLADQQEKDYDLMSKIKGAMIYPAFILGGLAVVGAIMMIFVVPKLTDILKETGAQLPVTTRMLMAVSGFTASYWWLIGLMAVGLVIFLRFFISTPVGRRWWDMLKIKIPILGSLFQRIYLVRFARSLATLIAGGVPVVAALDIVADVVGNVVYKDLVTRTVNEVKDGNPIATVFLESQVVPVMASQMITTGEKTGKLQEVLEKLSAFYAREIDNLVTNLVSLIEPMIMVVMGVAVGIMVAAIIMPMYNLASQF